MGVGYAEVGRMGETEGEGTGAGIQSKKKKKANLKNAFNDQSKNVQMQIFPKYFFSIKLESTGRKRQPYSHRKEKPLMWVMMQRVGNLMK